MLKAEVDGRLACQNGGKCSKETKRWMARTLETGNEPGHEAHCDQVLFLHSTCVS